ncbi:MAG: hypothetical protein QOJ39_1753, partial [Candidatus Eremiobacteraeota bacterium]|nr:hypothetical protein [Candidatus Eremiobacteraeota bacterium]
VLDGSGISTQMFDDELILAIAALVPEVRVTYVSDGVRFGRGAVNAEVLWHRASAATVVMRHGCERVLVGNVPATPDGLNEIAADLVGFFCGAPLTTLALFPHADGQVRKPVARPRRRGPWDAPLIPLPFDPPLVREDTA